MKKLSVLAFLFLVSIASFGQSKEGKDVKAVKQLIQDVFDDVWSGLDSSKISQYHTEDFLLLEHGEVWTNETVANYTEKAKKRNVIPKRTNRFEYIEVRASKKTIWVAYHNYATFEVDGKETGKGQWLESALAVKTKDGWKLKLLHSTRVPVK